MALDHINKKLVVTEAPHVRSSATVSEIMLDVIIALMPALIAGVIVFGYRASVLALICVGSCVFFEWAWCKTVKKPVSIGDFSAVVTGLLLAMNLPVTLPLWMAPIGSLFAIIVVKQFFGGIGNNFMNPAVAARAFLLTSWAQAMTTWVAPFTKLRLFSNPDVVSSATPLAVRGGGEGAVIPSYLDLFLGNVSGCIGEVSALAILIGALYLLWRHVIDLKIPLSYLATVAVITFVFGGGELFTGNPLYHILSGGLLLGAFFMATDYTTTPYTPKGQIIFGIGCGVLTSVIRLWGGYPEGVSYSILLMNVAAPLIDRVTAPKRFGAKEVRADAE